MGEDVARRKVATYGTYKKYKRPQDRMKAFVCVLRAFASWSTAHKETEILDVRLLSSPPAFGCWATEGIKWVTFE